MEIIVGRKGEQSFPIADKGVSSKHVKLTSQPDGTVQVEDLGSTNGTFIDGIRIIKKVVSKDTAVQLGKSYTFRINEVIPEYETPNQADTNVMQEFAQLEEVWNKYLAEKIILQKNNASKSFLRMMPLFALGCLGYLLSCIPALSAYRTVVTLVGVGLGLVITWISYQSATKLPEQMERLNQQFQIDYVCPKCKQFLGFTPFEGLRKRGQCSMCKAKWI